MSSENRAPSPAAHESPPNGDAPAAPARPATEAASAPPAAPAPRSPSRKRTAIILVIAVIVLDILAAAVVPPYPKDSPGQPVTSIGDLITANLELPAPEVVYPEGHHSPNAIAFFDVSISNTILTTWLVVAVTELQGSVIQSRSGGTEVVKGITSIDGVALVNLEGAGMIGVPGTAQRLFAALREHGISVILISQASSEHSICFAVPRGAGRRDRSASCARRSSASSSRGTSSASTSRRDCSILAVVGDGMAGTPGVAAKMFGALSSAGVNVRAIAQGASERNISAIIDARDLTRALRAVHASFYLSPHTISIGRHRPRARRKRADRATRIAGGAAAARPAISTCGCAGCMTSRAWRSADTTHRLAATWREALDRRAAPPTSTRSSSTSTPITCRTRSSSTARRAARSPQQYPAWLGAGIHVVTPNKRANSGALASVRRDRRRARAQSGAHYLYEATVGAGLPIIQTLRDLRETGDDIRQIEGILSGTLSYLFNVWDGSQPFSAVLLDARRQGFTEPDPRDDLSGMDVGRKLIILAREMGLRLELDDLDAREPGATGAARNAQPMNSSRGRPSSTRRWPPGSRGAVDESGPALRGRAATPTPAGRPSAWWSSNARTRSRTST